MSLYSFIVLNLVLNSIYCTTLKLHLTSNDELRRLPRFWTNTGFCPSGKITNSEIVLSLLSDDTRTNLELIGALPNGAISSVRIHWLLELVKFVKFRNGIIPVYDFSDLELFLDRIDETKLAVGFEFMGNPGEIFNMHNVSQAFLWKDLVFQIVEKVLKRYGVDVVLKWKFESWNEPDLRTYNTLHFSTTDYLQYLKSIREGLDAASRTVTGDIHIKLSGPAGLFKNRSRHQLCWTALEKCNNNKQECYFDAITYHRKGQGRADEILSGGIELIRSFFKLYSNLKQMEFSNDEADPIAGWSTPRDFQSDVRYATTLVTTVLQHWRAIRNTFEFRNLLSISHDNAFLSYHPHEFEQRTLLTRFQMNNTSPPHTQFIQKPVYAALGLLGNLAEFASDVKIVKDLDVFYLITSSASDAPFYSAIILQSYSNIIRTNFIIDIDLKKIGNETFAYIVESIESDITDPVKVWKYYGSPPYPNNTVRTEMRSSQVPRVLHTKVLQSMQLNFAVKVSLRTPWIALLRICSSEVKPPGRPYNLRVRKVTSQEVLIIWNEVVIPERCLMDYAVYYQAKDESEWKEITKDQHVPFLSYQFQPKNGQVNGMYKVRGVNIFRQIGEFSDTTTYP